VGAGAPAGNQNAKTHGFYSRYYTAEELKDLEYYVPVDGEIDGEIKVVRVALRRALRILEDDDSDPALAAALVPLVYAGSRTVARLLRDKKILNGEDRDSVMRELSDALDELGSEWGIGL